MVTGIEALVGVTRDATFGPPLVVLVEAIAAVGRLADVLGDRLVSLDVTPIACDRADAASPSICSRARGRLRERWQDACSLVGYSPRVVKWNSLEGFL